MKFKTCKRYNDPGHAHELTFSCYKNQPFLSNSWVCELLCQSIVKMKSKCIIDLWAFVFMPTHIHLLIYPKTEEYDISSILKSIKQPSSQRILSICKSDYPSFLKQMTEYKSNGKTTYRFWQRGGGYDRNIYKMDTIKAVIDYIHHNPVRKGLVDNPADWKWSSAGFYYCGSNSPLGIDKSSFEEVVGG
ncbi:MAG: hypothetical protein GF315_05720 [candidate division Zixibacteria bacterium]|nr:hypothetical protein [candidate division Zixibacteria bacterium]